MSLRPARRSGGRTEAPGWRDKAGKRKIAPCNRYAKTFNAKKYVTLDPKIYNAKICNAKYVTRKICNAKMCNVDLFNGTVTLIK